ncbi:MAG: HAMP domain-containing protein [Nitrospirae bacterium]|nr:HAMP domain-containing protein [Nitrospirota bacterium]
MSAETDKDRDFSKKGFFKNLFRLSIVKKILYGYLTLTFLIILISVFALSSLERLNRINESIVREDVQVIETTNRMIDNIFAEELYARRYFILKSSEMLALFRERNLEFNRMLGEIRALSVEYNSYLERLASAHEEYSNMVLTVSSSASVEVYNGQIQQKQNEIISLIKDVSSQAKGVQHRKMHKTEQIGSTAFRVAGILCGAGIILSISTALLITRNISRSVSQLKQAAHKISEGDFEYISDVNNRDEFGELSQSFTEMAKRLKRLEAVYLDTNPLTHLPGGIAVENEITNRLSTSSGAAFCFVDLDNFKAFNDCYSYARGSEVIKAAARIIEEVVSEAGTQGDFIGHIGGDDFVFITSLNNYAGVCERIIERFDKKIVQYYDTGDLKRGFITSKNRQDVEMQFSIMTISIAVITRQQNELINQIKLGETAAELKHYAKSIPRSIWVTERRQGASRPGQDENVIRFPKHTA